MQVVLQVVALQAGRFEIGAPLPEPVAWMRPDHYGQVTVNVGVFVPELHARSNPEHGPRGVINDSHCGLRARLSHIATRGDTWWPLTDDAGAVVDQIRSLLIDAGIPFLERFGSRDAIGAGWVAYNEDVLRLTQVARLDVAMIHLRRGDVDAARMEFERHLIGCREAPLNPSHETYVRGLAIRLGLGPLDPG